MGWLDLLRKNKIFIFLGFGDESKENAGWGWWSRNNRKFHSKIIRNKLLVFHIFKTCQCVKIRKQSVFRVILFILFSILIFFLKNMKIKVEMMPKHWSDMPKPWNYSVIWIIEKLWRAFTITSAIFIWSEKGMRKPLKIIVSLWKVIFYMFIIYSYISMKF